jgi:hypothetical protein
MKHNNRLHYEPHICHPTGKLGHMMRCVKKKVGLWTVQCRKLANLDNKQPKRKALFEILEDWCLETKTQAYPVLKASSNQMRRVWIIQASQVQANRPDQLSTRKQNRPGAWSMFWNLKIPHAIVTSWWRMLLEKIT